jgi:hypothetical protein
LLRTMIQQIIEDQDYAGVAAKLKQYV